MGPGKAPSMCFGCHTSSSPWRFITLSLNVSFLPIMRWGQLLDNVLDSGQLAFFRAMRYCFLWGRTWSIQWAPRSQRPSCTCWSSSGLGPLQPYSCVLAHSLPEVFFSVPAASQMPFPSFTELTVFTLYAHRSGWVSMCPHVLFGVWERMYRI